MEQGNTSSLDEQQRRVLEGLREFHGSIGKVAERAGFTRVHTSRVLNGAMDQTSGEIWEAAAHVLLELREERQERTLSFEELAQRALAIG